MEEQSSLSKIHPSWMPHLTPLLDTPMLDSLRDNVLSLNDYFPEKMDIFNVFSMPIKDIKVVILGQDPYPKPGQAIGYAFAVNMFSTTPQSLQIIKNEIVKEYAEMSDSIKGRLNERIHSLEWRELRHWTEKGVFLLNTALTVGAYNAGSHLDYWKDFTEGVVKIISKEVNPIWLLWGKHAKEFKPIITSVDGEAEYNILEAPHPATESYSGGNAGFYGNNHFVKVNGILMKSGIEPIEW